MVSNFYLFLDQNGIKTGKSLLPQQIIFNSVVSVAWVHSEFRKSSCVFALGSPSVTGGRVGMSSLTLKVRQYVVEKKVKVLEYMTLEDVLQEIASSDFWTACRLRCWSHQVCV